MNYEGAHQQSPAQPRCCQNVTGGSPVGWGMGAEYVEDMCWCIFQHKSGCTVLQKVNLSFKASTFAIKFEKPAVCLWSHSHSMPKFKKKFMTKCVGHGHDVTSSHIVAIGPVLECLPGWI